MRAIHLHTKTAHLLTGQPGVGKTTIIREAVARMEGKAGGFYTEEIRTQGVRQGFKIVTLNGCSAMLAHVDIRSSYHVSKYGVDIDSLNKVGVSAIRQANRECDLVVIDEIGKMELFSSSFKDATIEAIESGKKVLGTIMLKPDPWAGEIKHRPEVNLVWVTKANHHEVLAQLLCWLEAEKRTG